MASLISTYLGFLESLSSIDENLKEMEKIIVCVYMHNMVIWTEMLMEPELDKKTKLLSTVTKNKENGDRLFSGFTVHCQNLGEANFY